MRVAIAKPDHGIVGGYEHLVRRVSEHLAWRGHEIVPVTVDATRLGRRAYGVDVPTALWDQAPAFFDYFRLAEVFAEVELSSVDLLVSSQPPSYAARHPRHLCLFSHHPRPYYDLADVYVEAGFADPAVHAQATDLLREVDQRYLEGVTRILATSPEVAARLERFNGLHESVGVFEAGLGYAAELPAAAADEPTGHVLCVSRHEFPKRTELFVHAAMLEPTSSWVSVGAGGRLGYVQRLARQLHRSPDPTLCDRPLWCSSVPWIEPEPPEPVGPLRFTGFVTEAELASLYAGSLCVVAPAYLEDYGLTVVEAMAHGRAVVVCADGGNLPRLVTHEVDGLVVEPTGAAIAAAVGRLRDDHELRRRLAAEAKETAARYTWERAMGQIDEAIEQVRAAAPGRSRSSRTGR